MSRAFNSETLPDINEWLFLTHTGAILECVIMEPARMESVEVLHCTFVVKRADDKGEQARLPPTSRLHLGELYETYSDLPWTQEDWDVYHQSEIKSCPKCETWIPPSDDYLCEFCRFGIQGEEDL
jgi:hypothetical protein